MATTFTEIVTRAKSRSDQTQGDFVEASEWLDFTRDAYRRLYMLLVKRFKDYFEKLSGELTITADGLVNAPADLFRICGVDIKSGTEWIRLNPRSRAERSQGNRSMFRSFRSIGYRYVGRDVHFYPAASAVGQVVRLLYQPHPAKIAALSEELPIDMEQWSEFIVLEVAMMAAMKEETDISDMRNERNLMLQEIKEQAMARMYEDPEGIVDVRGDEDGYGVSLEEY